LRDCKGSRTVKPAILRERRAFLCSKYRVYADICCELAREFAQGESTAQADQRFASGYGK